MTQPVAALVGHGCCRRVDELRAELEPAWQIIICPTFPDEDARHAIAAVGMPEALEWRREMPGLKLLQLPGAGLDGLNSANLPDTCEVCNVFEHEGSVAEYVFASLFRLQHTWLNSAAADFKLGRWWFFDRIGEPCRPSLCGKTFGIVGFGHIGQRCASIASSFNMRVVATTPRIPSNGGTNLTKHVGFLPSVREVAAVADYLLVACPLTAETRGLIDRSVIDSMPTGAVLINTARAQVVDEGALFDALVKGRLGGAVLDVWMKYPRDRSDILTGSSLPFHELGNVLATPHLAANTDDMVRRRWAFIGANLNRLLAGKPRLNRVKLSN